MKVKDMAMIDKPIMKLKQQGAESLSDIELISLLVQGTKEKDSMEIAQELYCEHHWSLNELYHSISNTEGKHATLLAAFELGKRKALADEIARCSALVISSSRTVFAQFNNMLSVLDHEELWALYCSKNGKVLLKKRISEGGTDFAGADIKKILKYALQCQASNIALVHNHPHSSVNPSRKDRELTANLKDAMKYFDLRLLDHVVIADGKYYSFADKGEL